MSEIAHLFVTHLYRARLMARGWKDFNAALEAVALSLAADDAAGNAWCEANSYQGYTSYASLDDLPWRFPDFADLKTRLDAHAAKFADALELDLMGGRLELDSLWVNVLDPGGHHAAHIHPHSVISGTCYVTVPEGAAAIRFEDPRLPMMMAAPPRRAKSAPGNRAFLSVAPKPGDVIMWESWLRHEVPVNNADSERVSISFNYSWRQPEGDA